MPHKLIRFLAIFFSAICLLVCTTGFIACLVWTVFSDSSMHPWQYLGAGLGIVGAVLSAETMISLKDSNDNDEA